MCPATVGICAPISTAKGTTFAESRVSYQTTLAATEVLQGIEPERWCGEAIIALKEL